MAKPRFLLRDYGDLFRPQTLVESDSLEAVWSAVPEHLTEDASLNIMERVPGHGVVTLASIQHHADPEVR